MIPLNYNYLTIIKKYFLCTTIFTGLLICSASAQNVLGGLLNKARINLNLPQISSSNKQVNSIDEKSNYQPVSLTAADTSKYFKVADDLFFNIGDTKKLYPRGYKPKWNGVGQFAQIQFEKVNLMQGRIKRTETRGIGLDEFNGKAYVYFGTFLTCNCAARLIPDNNQIVIGSTPQTFFVKDFYQITADGTVTSKPCKGLSMSYYDTNGWKLKISLAMDATQNLLMNVVLQSITNQSNYISRNGTDVSAEWTSGDVTLPNLMSAEKAISTAKQIEQNIKDAAASKLAREKKEEEERVAFEASIKNSLQKVAAQQRAYADYNLECIKTATYNVYVPGSGKVTHWVNEATGTTDLNTGAPIYTQREVVDSYGSAGETVTYTGLKNTCNKAITIKGITKLISESNTIYYVDASIHLDAGEIYKEKFVISGYYNPKTAEVNSTHYYKNNLMASTVLTSTKKATVKKK